MAIRNPHLALPLVLAACGLNQPTAPTKTPEVSATSPQITETATETPEIPEDTETPSIITTEGKLYPTEWGDRFVIDMTSGFDYPKLSEILADNATKILANTSQPVLSCHAQPSRPENADQLVPSRLLLGYTYANIAAVYEIQTPEGTSYVVTITCKGTHPSEVLAKAINLLFSLDLANSPEAQISGDPDYLYNYTLHGHKLRFFKELKTRG
jgi:hypothetical protein